MPIKEATENKEDKREFLVEDRRGKHKNHKTVEQNKEDIRRHIESVPKKHYFRAKSTRHHIEGGTIII
jgi:hypothetical protein